MSTLGPGHSVIWLFNLPRSTGSPDADFAELKGKPNILIFIADDLGYSDLASYGNPSIPQNFIDKLAFSGIRFQSVYAADSLCSPARASLLTGSRQAVHFFNELTTFVPTGWAIIKCRLPIRNGIINSDGGLRVFVPTDSGGLLREEVTLPEMLKTAGYRTGFTGKWHLGINRETSSDGFYLPRNHGFDFAGLTMPFSNVVACDESKHWMPDGPLPPQCFLYNDTEVIQQPINFTGLTSALVADFNRFMSVSGSRDVPFFFYFSFPQVHTALFSWKAGDFRPSRGLFNGDIAEMASAMKDVMERLGQLKMSENTMVIFLSDHGPHVELCLHGGSSAQFKGLFKLIIF